MRLTEGGGVPYSQRLTVQVPCQLDVRLYPLDIQTCYLNISSFAHLSHQLKYSWALNPVTLAKIRWARIDNRNRCFEYEL